MKKRMIFSILFVFIAAALASGENTAGRVFWRGMVDDRVQLVIKYDRVETRTVAGKAYPDGVYSFTTPMTDEARNVSVSMTKGRGKASVIQQPAEDNEYTAIVEIIDDKGGAKEYQLEISWQ
jgi:hypothetical protein